MSAAQVFDISVPIGPGMPVFPGDTQPQIALPSSIARGDAYNLTALRIGAHAGTHVDAPRHFLDDGPAVESLPLDALIGPAFVVDATAVSGDIDAAALERLTVPAGATRLIFKTVNSALWGKDGFSPDFRGLTNDAARALVDMGVRLVGIDYLSVAPFSDPIPPHVTLLKANVVVLEGLDLRKIEPGEYQLLCLPLLIPGSDGAPARAVLIRD